MEICPPPARISRDVRAESIIEAKNKIRLGHDECCNCCCCCLPQPSCYKYIQPEIPKTCKPMRYYWKPDVPIDDNTTYRLSYWEGPVTVANAQIARPEDSLTVGDGEISDETIHRMSYLGNWCVKPEEPCSPCTKSWLGRGPMQDVTTQKHDFTWKMVDKSEPFKKLEDNLYPPCATMSDDTTYRLSYYNSTCRIPAKPLKPFRRYEKLDVPMEGCTTYRLSYWPNEAPVKEPQPWKSKLQYVPPVTPMDGCTTYKLSYWPNSEPRRVPFSSRPETDNLLNVGCCFDDNTTYKLSYFGCGGERPDPAKPQPDTVLVSDCPLSHDTINRLSYLGNWCVKPESPCSPCDKNLLGRGPMQDVTTQKHDYTWKNVDVTRPNFRPEDNLEFSPLPLECCTTHRLSYFPNNVQGLIKNKILKPVQKYCPSGVPMETETTSRLSYQPVEIPVPQEKPWITTAVYHPPMNQMEDNTTYNMSYIPPGTLVPLDPCSPPCPPSNMCAAPSRPPCPPSVTRPCDLGAVS